MIHRFPRWVAHSVAGDARLAGDALDRQQVGAGGVEDDAVELRRERRRGALTAVELNGEQIGWRDGGAVELEEEDLQPVVEVVG